MIEDHVQQKGVCKKKTLNAQVCDLKLKVLFFTVLQETFLKLGISIKIIQVNLFFFTLKVKS